MLRPISVVDCVRTAAATAHPPCKTVNAARHQAIISPLYQFCNGPALSRTLLTIRSQTDSWRLVLSKETPVFGRMSNTIGSEPEVRLAFRIWAAGSIVAVEPGVGSQGVSMMRKAVVAAAAMVSALTLAGCSTPEDYNAGRGAVIGGTTGALIGGLATGRPAGALAGAAIGAGSGAILGAAATPRPLPVEPYDAGPYGAGAYGAGPYGAGPYRADAYGTGPGGPGPDGVPPKQRCAKMGYDADGQPVCLKLAGYPRS